MFRLEGFCLLKVNNKVKGTTKRMNGSSFDAVVLHHNFKSRTWTVLARKGSKRCLDGAPTSTPPNLTKMTKSAKVAIAWCILWSIWGKMYTRKKFWSPPNTTLYLLNLGRFVVDLILLRKIMDTTQALLQ